MSFNELDVYIEIVCNVYVSNLPENVEVCYVILNELNESLGWTHPIIQNEHSETDSESKSFTLRETPLSYNMSTFAAAVKR